MAKEHNAASERREHGPQRRAVDQTIPELYPPWSRVGWWMVDQYDRRTLAHGWVRQDLF